MSARRWRVATLTAALAVALAACEALITDPAPATSEVTLSFQVAAAPLGGTAAAFTRVNRVWLRFVRADQTSRDTVLFVRPTDGRLRAGVVLETRERISALGVVAQLRAGPLPLFEGSAIVKIDPGVPTTANIPLLPLPGRVRASQPAITLVGLGQTAQLSSAVLYATADTIEGLAGIWSSDDPTIVTVSPNGLALSVQPGTTNLIVGLAGLADTVRATVQ